MQVIQLEVLPELVGFPGMSMPALNLKLKELDIPVLDKTVDKRLFTLAWAVPPKIDWKKSALLDDLSPTCGIGAAAYCIRNQVKKQIRIVGHIPGVRREMLLTRNNNSRQQRRVRWYPSAQMFGENKSLCRFNITGFNREDAPMYFVLMGLNGDDPFWWSIPTSYLIDQWEKVDAKGRYYKRNLQDMFRVHVDEWDNPSGSLQVLMSKKNKQFVFDSPAKVGL